MFVFRVSAQRSVSNRQLKEETISTFESPKRPLHDKANFNARLTQRKIFIKTNGTRKKINTTRNSSGVALPKDGRPRRGGP